MRKILIIFFSVLLLSLSSNLTTAEGEFRTSAEVTYEVSEKGVTTVTHKITLENLVTDLYATSYTLSLSGLKPISPKAFQGPSELKLTETSENDETRLKIDFPDALVGIGKKRDFKVIYEDTKTSIKTGEVWEISIPRIKNVENYEVYQTTLIVPNSFGNLAYITPEPLKKLHDSKNQVFTFDKQVSFESAILASFGQFQVFLFDITYHLENPLSKNSLIDIVIPPDTPFQKVSFTRIHPEPANVNVDEDGNWLATYELTNRQRIDVKVSGAVQLYPKPRSFKKPKTNYLTKTTTETEVWQANDPQIQKLAKKLKTPKAIYDYVSENLSYDFERVRPNVERLGAKKALESPKNAICMEYTDLFIALARSAGIPSREVNGFAYSENPVLQPLSLVADVLHAWPEYYDYERELWIPVDPTWGSTTGGVDFFSKLDLRHFAFVFHGVDSFRPYSPGSYKLGPNPQKDVYVSFGTLPNLMPSIPLIIAENRKDFKVLNKGYNALYDTKIEVYWDTKKISSYQIEILPPYASREFQINLPSALTPWKLPEKIVIVAGDQVLTVPTGKNGLIVTNLAILLFVITIFALFVFVRVRHVRKIAQKTS